MSTDNTPTPAQALGECLKRLDKHELQDTLGDGQAAIAFLRQHGQHFAGLEERYTVLSAAHHVARRTSEYWKAEHLAANEKLEAADARVREAEGLLRDALPFIGWTGAPNGMIDRVAAFLAARG